MSDALKATDEFSALNANAPRIALGAIENMIDSVVYLNAGNAAERCGYFGTRPMFLMTLCFLTFRNGFVEIGYSAPASPENFDVGKGRALAYENAVRAAWPKLGFALRERLSYTPCVKG